MPPVVCLYQDIRFLDSPDDELMRIACGKDNGFIISTPSALQLLAQTDAAINSMLRHQIENDRDGFLSKVRSAALAMLDRENMTAEKVATMIEEVLFQEVLEGLDSVTRASLSTQILQAVQEVERMNAIP